MNKQSGLADYFRAMSHRDTLKQTLPRLPSAKKRNYQLYDNARGVASTAPTYGGRLDEHKYLSEAVSKIREQYDANDIANDNPRVNDSDMTAVVTKLKGNKGSSVSYTFMPKQDKDTSEGYHKTQDRLLKERSKKASYDESVLKGFVKRALKEGKPDALAQLLSTLGYVHPQHIVGSLLVGQEKAHNFYGMSNPENDKKIQRAIAMMKKKYPDRLKDVTIRHGGGNLIEDYKNIWNNKKTFLPQKMLDSLVHPLVYAQTNVSRADHYNPATNTANIWNKVPAISMHELGHAVDFNKEKDLNSKLYNASYELGGRSINQLKIPGLIELNPMTQWAETQANKNVFNAAPKEEYKSELRRRLWPARGTYVGGALGAAAGLFMNPGLYQGNIDQESLKELSKYILGGAVGGAVGGRGIAEATSYYHKNKRKDNE